LIHHTPRLAQDGFDGNERTGDGRAFFRVIAQIARGNGGTGEVNGGGGAFGGICGGTWGGVGFDSFIIL